MRKYVIKTNKGYICERNDYKEYPLSRSFVGLCGNFFNMRGSSGVDMLGFTDYDKAEAKLKELGGKE